MDNPPNRSMPTQSGIVSFITDGENLTGDIELCQYSSITATFIDINTDMTRSINTAGSGGVVYLIMDESSTSNVTADSYLSSLDCNYSNITGSGKVYVNGLQVYYYDWCDIQASS